MNEFDEYVRKYSVINHVTIEQALTHKMVQEFAKYLQEKKGGEQVCHNLKLTSTTINIACGVDES